MGPNRQDILRYAGRFGATADRRTRPLPGQLRALEAESIFIMREVVAEFRNPVMLYSIGKDSSVMLHLALKAFWPSKPPFPLMHIATGWDFRDMIEHRDALTESLGLRLIVQSNSQAAGLGLTPFNTDSREWTRLMLIEALKAGIDAHGFDAALGGGRRDEEKSRAKERVFSVRSPGHAWDPRNQRPELWNLYNTRVARGETVRVFPLSNWTEFDVWEYIRAESIPIVPLYFAKRRPVVRREGVLIVVDDERMEHRPGERPSEALVRFRTLGDWPLSGATPSEAATLEEVLAEMRSARTSERQGRLIDGDEAASMEKKKREGYF
ncbi:MAG TPA: sulfate adenylyltransferase subunit CysD [Pyrinomonadaceae bacterium]|jgi:sulfate adenylyltransferase subunit 2